MPEESSPSTDESTGLPGIQRWKTVYALVVAIFVLWVGLLTWISFHYT